VPEPVNARRVGELESATDVEGVRRGREAEETAELERACLSDDALPPRGVVTLSNLVERPTVESDEGS